MTAFNPPSIPLAPCSLPSTGSRGGEYYHYPPRVGISILYPAWGVINIITLTTRKESQR